MEYLPIVAEELPKGKEANESSVCPYMGKGEQGPRMTQARLPDTVGKLRNSRHTRAGGPSLG